MGKKKTFQKGTLLDEVAQLKIYGGTSSSMDSEITVYIGKGCGNGEPWADCKRICIFDANRRAQNSMKGNL